MIEVRNLSKIFIQGNSQPLKALDQLNFHVTKGKWLSVTGPSGSGKSTLLAILAGLDSATSGELWVDAVNMGTLSEDQRAQFRAENFGFVFQSFRLMPTMTALENVQLPLELLKFKNSKERALKILEEVGLGARAAHFPSQLSGGEQQRVAVARAFVTQPKVLFADEPTGNLDTQNGELVLKLLKQLQSQAAATLVVVTHDKNVAALGDAQLVLKDGKIL